MANVIERTANNVWDWFTARAPGFMPFYRKHMTEYYAPKNFNIWYVFGALSMLVLVIQIVTGIFLVMHYKPDAGLAFASVEYIMRDVPWGWLIRYMHSTGASAFFVVVYLHMFRGLMYGSYRKPRELVWLFGCAIFLVLMAEAMEACSGASFVPVVARTWNSLTSTAGPPWASAPCTMASASASVLFHIVSYSTTTLRTGAQTSHLS